jgi:hypothetical protein
LQRAPFQEKGGYATKRGRVMEGIRFVTDEKGKKVAVQLDLEKHGGLWEDIQDGLVAEARRHEKSIPFEDIKASINKSGKLKK